MIQVPVSLQDLFFFFIGVASPSTASSSADFLLADIGPHVNMVTYLHKMKSLETIQSILSSMSLYHFFKLENQAHSWQSTYTTKKDKKCRYKTGKRNSQR